MSKWLYKRWGEQVDDPNLDDFKAALEELKVENDEHPDCFLNNEDEWSLGAFGSGLVILENVETDEGPWHIRNVSNETVIEMWQLMMNDKLEEIKTKYEWKDGYGS